MRTQSSYCWWRHHLAAAAGSPYMVPVAASAPLANPSARTPATAANVAVLAMAAILLNFMACPFLVPLSRSGLLRKGSGLVLSVISTNPWGDPAPDGRNRPQPPNPPKAMFRWCLTAASAQACKGAENVLDDAISVTARLQAQV